MKAWSLAVMVLIWTTILFWWSFLYDWTVFLAFFLSYALLFSFLTLPLLHLREWKALLAAPLLWLVGSYFFQLIHHAGFIGEISVFFLFLPSLGWLGSPLSSVVLIGIFSSLAYAAVEYRKKKRFALPLMLTPLALICMLLIPAFGEGQLPQDEVVLVQGNYAEDWMWRKANVDMILSAYSGLSGDGGDIVVWPEYALAGDIRGEYDETLSGLSVGRILIVGHTTDLGLSHHDSASVFREGTYEGRYDSVAPVFFNEQVEPGGGLYLVESQGTMYGIIICYEELNRGLFREYGEMGADAIISLVNDQHIRGTPGEALAAGFIRLRAKEFKMPVYRATNTGLTMAVDGKGRVVSELEPGIQGVLKVPGGG